jgi:hypothetical protein
LKNEDYVFYFDECYQDRKILIKDTTFNSMSDNSFDSYIGLFWGCKQKELHRIIPLINDFEQKHKSIFCLSNEQELKSDIIKKKNYKYGLKSFNKNATDFYSDLFMILEHINPIIQIDAISKVEYFLKVLFHDIDLEVIALNRNAFIYSLTKLILNYKDPILLNSIKSIHDSFTAEEFRLKLLSFISIKLEEIRGIERKESEENTLKEFIIIIQNVSFGNMKYEALQYPYYFNFVGLNNLLYELSISINRVKIIIDEEINTYNSSKVFNYKKVKQANSENSIQIRLCDWLCGFVGRFIYALSNDISAKESNGESIDKKRLLSKDWFEIDKKTFDFYLRLYDFFLVKHEYHWTIMTLHFADPIVEFCTLLRYFASYESFEQYLSTDVHLHQELYNTACINELESRHKAQ